MIFTFGRYDVKVNVTRVTFENVLPDVNVTLFTLKKFNVNVT